MERATSSGLLHRGNNYLVETLGADDADGELRGPDEREEAAITADGQSIRTTRLVAQYSIRQHADHAIFAFGVAHVKYKIALYTAAVHVVARRGVAETRNLTTMLSVKHTTNDCT